MDKAKFLHEAQAELQRHVRGTYVDKGVSVALGGNGIVVPGCEACRKRINTNSQYLRHLAEDVLPGFWRAHSAKLAHSRLFASPVSTYTHRSPFDPPRCTYICHTPGTRQEPCGQCR